MADKRRLHVTTNRNELVSAFLDVGSSGIVAGIEKPGENLHFTYCLDPGGLWNCHIKHNGVTVWQKRKTLEELMRDLEDAIQCSMVRWNNKDTLMAIDGLTVKEINDHLLPDKDEYNLNINELVERLIPYFRENKLVRRRLGNIKKDEVIIGFHERYDDAVFIAMPKHMGIVIPLNPEKGIMGAILPLQGLLKYLEYAIEHGFFEIEIEMDELKELKYALFEAGLEL